jgi:hypothetical protein
MAEYTLRKVSIIGHRNPITWSLRGGSTLTENLTDEQYADLATRGWWQRPVAWRPADAIGLTAAGQVPVYDTPSGQMEAGDVRDVQAGFFIVAPNIDRTRARAKPYITLSRQDVTGNNARLTLTRNLPGVTLVNGVLTIQDTV